MSGNSPGFGIEGDDYFVLPDSEDDLALAVIPLRNNGAGDGNYVEDGLHLRDPEQGPHRLVAGRSDINEIRDMVALNGQDHIESEEGPLQNNNRNNEQDGLNDPLEFFCTGVLWTTLMHPFHHAGVLMQLGFDPFPGEIVRVGLLGSRSLLPDTQHLIGYIHQSDGFFALFRGLKASIAGNFLSYLMESAMVAMGLGTRKLTHKTGTSVKDVSRNLLVRSIRLTLNLVVTQPLTVVSTRQIAQFIGCENVYKTLAQTICKIFTEEGVAGFYAGFVPRLLRNIGVMAVTTVATALFFHYWPQHSNIQVLNEVIVNVSSSYALHPLSVVGTCMDVQGSPLAAAMPSQMPHYEHWTKCFYDIYQGNGFYHRGGVLFWRTVPVKGLNDFMGRPK
ncbi:mitochondrial carrier homolog 2 [Drosophila pseudoobscura]|uniref:Mitochondrial carrier homolog 2 n=1 Tax=Drosophila pseudoobscura pseudoobscura TaxID=46245 RepID=A0A6I8V016_DROPS|nr:mitochondrial carrier homolog 2 [Drosophila pseudoobscura]